MDEEIVRTLHAANVPLLLGIQNAMGALKQLKQRRDFALGREPAGGRCEDDRARPRSDAAGFLSRATGAGGGRYSGGRGRARIIRAAAAALMRKFGQPVALKAEAPGLLHKSDLGCVKLNCPTEGEVTRATTASWPMPEGRLRADGVLVQPMVSGVAECFAGIIDDPLYGPAVVFGLGGIFVELCARPSPRWRR